MFNFFKKKKKSNFDSDKFDWLLNESTLIFHSGESLLHYYNSETKKDLQNPAWQNQGIYFWREDENFEKKSLPDDFLSYEKKLFILNKIPNYISISAGKAIPWFGKPGGGDKFFFNYNDNAITIEEARELKIISYFKYVDLHKDNLHILNERDQYFFLIKNNNVFFKNGKVYFENDITPLSELYKIGAIKIIEFI